MTRKVAFWLMATGSLLVALISYRFVGLGLELSFPTMTKHITDHTVWFLMHIVASPIALATGVFQFMPGLRRRRPELHRWTGRLYGLAILVGGVGGLMMAWGIPERPVAAWGFGLLSLLWVGFTANAVRLAMAGNTVEHSRWMIRSYALTFAAVTLRLQLVLMAGMGIDYFDAANILAWSCWLPNWVVVELWLRTSWNVGGLKRNPTRGSSAAGPTRVRDPVRSRSRPI